MAGISDNRPFLVRMPSVTQGPEFGISLPPTRTDDPGQALHLVQLADRPGYDLVGIQDHPYQWRFFDTWTLISWLAEQTSRLRFFPDVANLPLRPPALLVKSAAALDVLTGGVELGLGAGAFWDAVAEHPGQGPPGHRGSHRHHPPGLERPARPALRRHAAELISSLK